MKKSFAKKIDIESERHEVKSVIDQFTQVWETKDLELLSKIMAHDTDMVNFGTDAVEKFVGWIQFKEAVEKMLSDLENVKIIIREQHIKAHSSENVAWFSQIWDWEMIIKGELVHSEGQRFTGVLEKRDDNWVFVQFHNSVPVG